MTQIEYCNNLVFDKRQTLLRLCDRLFDANRGLGHPDKLAIIFGRANFVPDTRTGETTLKITKLRLPVLKASYKHTDLKQYGKDGGHNVAALARKAPAFNSRICPCASTSTTCRRCARFCMAPISVVWISNKTC